MVKNAQILFTASQYKLFAACKAKYNVIPKGRRYGFTSAAMSWVLGAMLLHKYDQILWGDTINGNIDRYVERMLLPKCKELGVQAIWEKQRRQFRIKGSRTVVDFRSADRPENWEGFGYDRIILNEAGIILQDEYLWENAVLPMLIDNKQSRAIISGTPKGKIHKGRESIFYKLFMNGQDPNRLSYMSRTVTTFDNPMLDNDNIQDIIAEMPSAVVRQEIYGEFIDISSSLFKREWLQYIDHIPEGLTITMGVDLAISTKETADKTAIVVTGKDRQGHYYILDTLSGHWTFNEQQNKIVAMARKWSPKDIKVEQVQYQTSMIQELVRVHHLPARGVVPSRDKVTRAMPVLAKFERGLIFLNRALEREFENEVLSFPTGKHDDYVDAMVYSIDLENIMRVRV